jgi:hypothetical protein
LNLKSVYQAFINNSPNKDFEFPEHPIDVGVILRGRLVLFLVYFSLVDAFGHGEHVFGTFELEVEMAGLINLMEDRLQALTVLNAVHD